MLCIYLRFIHARFHATPWGHHINEAVPEWPPSIWRLLRALIATWMRKSSDIEECEVSNLLKKITNANLPVFYLPKATQGHTRHYMPDPKKPGSLIFDGWINVTEPIYFIWQELDLEEKEKSLLKELIEKLSYFGRSESLCDAKLVEIYPEPNCFPEGYDFFNKDGFETVRMIAPSKDVTLDQLMKDTGNLQKERYSDPPGSRWVVYYRPIYPFLPKTMEKSKISIADKKTDFIIARYIVDSSVLPMIQDTIRIAESARRFLLFLSNGSSIFSGKDEKGLPLIGHKHAHFLPQDLDDDGKIDTLTVWCEEGFAESDLLALKQLRLLKQQGGRPDLNLMLLGFVNNSEKINDLRKSKKWISVTPFLLVHHQRKNREKSKPEAQVLMELMNRGIIKSKSDVTSIEKRDYHIFGTHKIHWLEYRRWREKSQPPEQIGFGFVLEFKEPVRGPICLGWGSHFGLGMFRSI